MTEIDLDAIEARVAKVVARAEMLPLDVSLIVDDVPALVARVRELKQKIADITETASIIHAHRFDADRYDDPDHASWLASFGETPAKRPDMFYAGVEYAVKRIRKAIEVPS